MEKAPIKKFAVEARRKLIADVTFQLERYGITEKGIVEPQTSTDKELVFDLGNGNTQTIKGERYVNQYRNLVAHVRGFYADGRPKQQLEQFIEKIAFTWFNRLIAIRFMEVNRYIPVRVLSSEIEGQKLPDLVASPFSGDLEFTDAEKQEIFDLQDANKEDDLFRFLFFKQCNDLSRILPRLFENLEGHNSFSELLVALSFNDPNGVVYHLVNDVEEPWFDIHATGQVQIIGWMYQYYNTEPKDKVFADLKKNIKISKQNIPAATQLFTPDWIVRYMVENSLGRLWYEGHPGFDKSQWKYYLDEAPQEPQVEQQLQEIRAQYAKMEPEQLKVIDPCMGSGHILCYLFDVLMQIYLDNGYSKREAVRSILENNLFGLDIDERAAQIAYFSVMMKAREYDSGFLKRTHKDGSPDIPQLYVYQVLESAYTDEKGNLQPKYSMNAVKAYGAEDSYYKNALDGVLRSLVDAGEYGSLTQTVDLDWKKIFERFDQLKEHSLYNAELEELRKIVTISKLLGQKYDVVVTNPPYMGSSGMDGTLANYIKANYPDSKSDLFAAFIEACTRMTKPNGYQAMITQHAWMFLSSYEKLREKMMLTETVNMAHLGARAFEEIGGEVVQTTSFVRCRTHIDGYKGTYCRLIEPTSQQGKEDMFLSGENRYFANQDNFAKIPGNPVAYWIPSQTFSIFDSAKYIKDFVTASVGIQTGDNDKFIHFWWEICRQNIFRDAESLNDTFRTKKWYPYNKGGEFRKWYGNDYCVIDWHNDGENIKNNSEITGHHYQQYDNALKFKPLVTWSRISTGSPAFRIKPNGYLSDMAGFSMYSQRINLVLLTAFCNSVVAELFLSFLAPTLNFMIGPVTSMPLKESLAEESVIEYGTDAIQLSKNDWDSFETSWDFKRHPLIKAITKYPSMMERGNIYLAECYDIWAAECEERFARLKANEEELNRIFIDIYGLQDELTPEVEDKDVTVRKADLQRDVKSLLSYAVGCLFGRYAPETDGLMYAGGAWDESRYHLIHPVKDNVLPLCDEEYFGENDLVNRVVEFIKEVFGASSLEDNLAFIAKALGNKGNTSREIIRNYFLKDFYADHCKIYQKRPIYWMFDSGKKNGFKALVYLHRWDADTTGRVYNNYLSPLLRTYAQQIEQEKNVYANSKDARASSLAQKRIDKLTLQQDECKTYEKDIAHLAALRIALDLDDGVKVNYVKAQTAADGKNLNVLVPIK
ncbi:MAG: BREX-1 system adenine-specific DNA-methyltransferase PglX [Faecalibacterium sp.]|nr:BREX-1 system adenine-specific DNA-methyltransferase PglX [Faecalibacterium sp.]